MNKLQVLYSSIVLVLTLNMSCASQSPTAMPTVQPATSTLASLTPTSEVTSESTPVQTVTEVVPITGHLMKPADHAPVAEKLSYDVPSSGIAAPYGDIYALNRLERPFLQDMSYVSDLDIRSFSVGADADWYYVSIELSGSDPNNSIDINYGVEIDLDFDGFGDFIVWAHPPYATTWETDTVQVFKDTDHDSGGASSLQSDTTSPGNGYDTLLFDGGADQTGDPDLAWVRVDPDLPAVLQFAFKKSFTGSFFMLGVVADAGLKDITKFDYNDHFNEADAGSPEQNTAYYPLGLLYAMDNTCWEAFGIQPTGYEPKLCQPIVQPTAVIERSANEPLACIPGFPPEECGTDENGNVLYDYETCQCK